VPVWCGKFQSSSCFLPNSFTPLRVYKAVRPKQCVLVGQSTGQWEILCAMVMQFLPKHSCSYSHTVQAVAPLMYSPLVSFCGLAHTSYQVDLSVDLSPSQTSFLGPHWFPGWSFT
jgi:hypothetical protein